MEPALLALQETYFAILKRGQLSSEEVAEIIAESDSNAFHVHSAQYYNADTQAMAVKKGIRIREANDLTVIDNVGIVGLYGPIFPRASMATSGATSVQGFVSDVVAAYNNSDIDAIGIRVDSPGGDVRGISEGAGIINQLAREGNKPIWAYADGYMASAAYYLGSAANRIVANKTAMLGSIGVVLTAQKKQDGGIEIVSNVSPNKRPDPEKKEGRAILEKQVNALAAIMVEDIAGFRGMTTEDLIKDFGEGSVFTGQPDALAAGMADELGTFSSFVEQLSELGRDKVKTSHRTSTSGSAKAEAQFSEEETMGLKDLLNKFSAKNKETVAAGADVPVVIQTGNDKALVEGKPLESGTAIVADAAPTITRADLEERFEAAGELFSEKLITSNKIWPSEQGLVAIELINAMADDAQGFGMVSFCTEDGEIVQGTREAAVRNRYKARPQHDLAERKVKAVKDSDVEAIVLTESAVDKEEASGPLAQEDKDRLLSLTPSGQAALAQRNGKK